MKKTPKEKFLLPWSCDSRGRTYNALGSILNQFDDPETAERVVSVMNLTASFTNEELSSAVEVEITIQEES